MENSTEDATPAQAAELIAILEECLRRHAALQANLQEVGERFRAELAGFVTAAAPPRRPAIIYLPGLDRRPKFDPSGGAQHEREPTHLGRVIFVRPDARSLHKSHTCPCCKTAGHSRLLMIMVGNPRRAVPRPRWPVSTLAVADLPEPEFPLALSAGVWWVPVRAIRIESVTPKCRLPRVVRLAAGGPDRGVRRGAAVWDFGCDRPRTPLAGRGAR